MDMNEFNLAEHLLADGNYLLKCDLLEARGIKTLKDSLDICPEDMLFTSEAQFLNRLLHIPQVLWSIGGDDGKKITLCTEREGDDIYNLISVYYFMSVSASNYLHCYHSFLGVLGSSCHHKSEVSLTSDPM